MSNTVASSQIRKMMRLARRNLSNSEQKTASSKLFTRLTTHPKILNAKKIAISLSFDGEIDTFPFIKWCWAKNKQIYLPVIHPFSKGYLLFLQYSDRSEMIINQYKIAEPKLDLSHVCPIQALDLIFTPLVAFDNNGNRIGMGGGYYDRMLTPWFKNKTGPYPIGLAHNLQQVDKLPVEHWDVPLPEIITPSAHYFYSI